ncbi:hypothetical protein BC831DRAFT_552646 [Entophlyctis helioformis]|nr:hypothetical protein BC831DRAFT_552646 [Entophlyctis helioformis]
MAAAPTDPFRDAFSRRNQEIIRANTKYAALVRKLERERSDLQASLARDILTSAATIASLRSALDAATARVVLLEADAARSAHRDVDGHQAPRAPGDGSQTVQAIAGSAIMAFNGMRRAFEAASQIFEAHALPGLQSLATGVATIHLASTAGAAPNPTLPQPQHHEPRQRPTASKPAKKDNRPGHPPKPVRSKRKSLAVAAATASAASSLGMQPAALQADLDAVGNPALDAIPEHHGDLTAEDKHSDQHAQQSGQSSSSVLLTAESVVPDSGDRLDTLALALDESEPDHGQSGGEMEQGRRPSRRRSMVSYALPSLKTKLRQGDAFTTPPSDPYAVLPLRPGGLALAQDDIEPEEDQHATRAVEP